MRIDRTEYSWMVNLRLFGRDWVFGYINIQEVAADTGAYGQDTVNKLLKPSSTKE